MQTNMKFVFFLSLSALIFLFTGCQVYRRPVELAFNPPSDKPRGNPSVSKRFQETAPKGKTVVDSAIELSKKYANLSEQKFALQQENLELIADNSRLKDRIAALEPELEQTKKELSQANDLLIEMRIELNNWKIDILGFRDEMRDADKAQLEVLFKILKVLGGEVKPAQSQAEGTEPNRRQEQGSTETSPDKQSNPESNENIYFR